MLSRLERQGAPLGPLLAGPDDSRVRRDLRYCVLDGVFFSIMVGIGETFFPAFAVYLGLGGVVAGLIATLPVVLGALIQLLAPALLRRVNSYPRFVGWCAVVQAAMYAPLILTAILASPLSPGVTAFERAPLTIVLLATVTVYWAALLASASSWITMASHVVPRRIDGAYFSQRNRWLHLTTLGGILAHGAVLAAFPGTIGYAVAFSIALVCRLLSALYLFHYSEPTTRPCEEERVGIRVFLRRFASGLAGRMFFAIAVMNIAAYVAWPYVNPYFLRVLTLDKVQMFAHFAPAGSAFAWLVAAGYAGRFAVLPAAARWIERKGIGMVLSWAAIGLLLTCPLYLLPIWLGAQDLASGSGAFVACVLLPLFAVQFVAGAAWGAWDLCVLLFSMRGVSPGERTGLLTMFAVPNEACKTLGSVGGGAVLDALDRGSSAYGGVFLIGTAARMLALVAVLRVVLPSRSTQPGSHGSGDLTSSS